MKNTNHYRQGDVGIAKTEKTFPNIKQLEPVNGRLVLAYGEVTGHHHSIAISPNVRLYEIVEEVEREAQKRMLLEVMETSVVEHQEHHAIPLEKGWYEVHIQIEYDPEFTERRVRD